MLFVLPLARRLGPFSGTRLVAPGLLQHPDFPHDSGGGDRAADHHYAQPRPKRTFRPPPRDCALDISFVDVRLGYRRDCLFHALSFIRSMRKPYHRDTESQKIAGVFSVTLW